MPSITDVERILHHIRVKLYPNYLPKVEGAYIARTDSDKTLSMEEVCAIMKTRAGFTGKLEDLIDYVHQYNDEVAYQLCDGFAVNNGYYSIYPNIGGTFNSVSEAHDQTKNPISFRFGIRSGLRKLIDKISVDITGLADTSGWIDQFVDTDENSTNTLYTAGDAFIIHGSKLKIAGDDPTVGVYFVPVDDPSKAVKVTRIIENLPTKVIGIAPKTEWVENRIEIRTQFAGSNTRQLKAPRVITSSFVLEEA